MRVLQSFPEGRVTTNPYLLQLSRSLGPHVEVLGFTWRRALTARYDVFHVHWPEILLQGRTPVRARARRMLFRLFLARLRLRRTAVVRTVHNVRSHESAPRRDQRLLRRFDQRTTLWIRLNPFTPVPAGALERTIPHGDYRDWYSAQTPGAPVPGRLLYFGLIRPYKGVDVLIDTFRQLGAGAPGDSTSAVTPTLRIVGSPQSSELAQRLQLAAAGDPRIEFVLRHASDAELADAIGAAELVVLPYADMHNSGAALLALSLDRPVLVPRNAVTNALAEEVGAEWVLTYSVPLSARVLADAIAGARRPRSTRAPDLSQRRWTVGAADHVEAYGRAVQALRSR
ncbi:beta-1,4-mannosyltransferase [Cryobacterium sp. CAN_C3]|uniref:glycosyltransferase n=1 Tax=unclassified Cryobacterium TaxID=2649013 RepID=UPI0018CA461E|nr:glycosyltransferase [Cryobacterium sp. CAN_C3]MEC5154842.1 beta-1,4-mannosyltransferase [Cryobacterium sp. CAN_C3]